MKRNIMKTLLAAMLLMTLLVPVAMMEEAPAGEPVVTEIETTTEEAPEEVAEDVPAGTSVDSLAEHDEISAEPADSENDVEELIIAEAYEEDVAEATDMALGEDSDAGQALLDSEGPGEATLDLNKGDVAEAQLFQSDSDFEIENGVLKKYKGNGGVVTIPDGVTIIGESAFEWNNSVTEVIIPNSVTIIGKNAFWDCGNLTSVNIPPSVTILEDGAFWTCEKLPSIVIPSSVKKIGTFAFDGCTSLSTVTIESGVTTIDSWAFKECINLKSIVIPDSVTEFGYFGLFDGCTKLQSVTIPKSIETIDGFTGCTSLEKISFSGEATVPGVVKIPETVTTIGAQAFKGCTLLTSVTIPESVKYIYDEAFYQCTNLSNVTIGAPKNPETWYTGVTIYDKAFTACSLSLVFHTQCDTAATKWAREHGYIVDACEHGRETVAGKPSTCMQTGLSDYDRCPYCYTEFTTQKELPLAPHTPVVVEGYAPTEFGKGKTNGSRCSVCYVTLQDRQDIPPLCESAPVVNAARGGKATVNAGQLFRLDMGGQAYKNLRVTGVNASWTTRNDGNIYMTISSGKKAKITFKVGKKKRTLTLIVNDPTIPTSVTLSAPTTVVKKGDTVTLTPVVPDGTNPGGFKWKSSNKKVATVKNGVVKFKKPGKVTITCTAKRGKKKAKIRFTVGK